MATTSRLHSGSQPPEIDIRQIISEAQTRWLRPLEVCEILQNYANYGFKLNPVPPVRPISGSMFLFDRKTLRYFRKDGHNWRKKKDGKTVREAHERLKIGSVDMLHCYYAHGEDNPCFQRRCYWMLTPTLEHIVLVHYREVTEGGRFSMSDSQHSVPAVHAASPPEVTHPVTSPDSLQEDGDLFEPEDVEDFKGGLQSTLLDQISPGAQGDTDLLRTSHLNVWPGSELRAEYPPNWYGSSSGGGGDSTLARLSGLLDSPTELTPKPGEYPPQLSNLQQFESNELSSRNAQMYVQQELFSSNNHYSGGNSVPANYSESLGKPSNMYGSEDFGSVQRQENIAAAMVSAGWGQEPESVPSSNAGFSQGAPSVSQSGAALDASQRTGMSQPPPPVYVKQESMSSWAATLTQVTTPGTHQKLMESLMSSNRMDVSDSLGVQDIRFQQTPPPKDILEAFDPRGLSREPQAQVEASLNNVAEGKAGKEAFSLYQKRVLSTRSDSLPIELILDSIASQEKASNNEDLRKQESFGRCFSYLSDFSNLLSPSTFPLGWSSTPTVGDQRAGIDFFNVSRQEDTGTGTSITSDLRFTITDFSPEWAYASEGVKVLVTGVFLGSYTNARNFKWCCMFGDIEVPAEVIGTGVLRCKAPSLPAGKVSLYVTCGDRQAHSEIRCFEYRSGVGRIFPDTKAELQITDERLLKVRLSRLLLSDSDSHAGEIIDFSGNLDSISLLHGDDDWLELENLAKTSDLSQDSSFLERLLQTLLKVRMQKWLFCKVQEEGKGVSVLDAHGLGVVHMAAALGYDWVITPMVTAGVPINFRDAQGWTALHWAAFFGKEQVVIALLGHGADPGAVTDPTPKCPAGQTPADLASMKGHAGIGGFLAEWSLTRRLSHMTLSENLDDLAMSNVAAEAAVAKLSRRESVKLSISGADDPVSVHESLQAVRNAARAAALIQAAFRQYSFRKREEDDLASIRLDEYGMTESQMQALLTARAAQRIQRAYRGHQEKKQQLAASRIQQKFRSWKVRRDYLKFRQRVVRIQAQVRGNLVRKRFKKLLWSVGVLEKLVLRWKRKRLGLRGFKSGDYDVDGKEDDEEFLKEGRKQAIVALEKSVTTVQTMVRSNEARAQYRRLREGSLRSELLGQFLSVSPRGSFTSANTQYEYSHLQQTYVEQNGDSQMQQIYLETSDQLMNFGA
ncbi:calmodulin-binding transcription activator 3 [Physcomitrium patens]|uniref:CG-1 domain-containing protein n=1 Tax=Physcomitrium patens TaxID=3218 RepID=A0A2K1KMA2_PHYPA|nr:calmodulin-binding transcription activator 3-like [Physcomitrium patens]XP_024374673.1 calmodulin-binding transcription activator 3-like [Physcomitrium patens]XP_024374674.1 calmodulin-binding transcription activator 3-like [Physcomitrium patens]PNR54912.1 hypothetical protein PHYPA_005805 [Physcomitrium patens]|eukprot:XP_024374672.1 calmodulin-binding transcription activator 3-like [Physcomitrella patens]